MEQAEVVDLVEANRRLTQKRRELRSGDGGTISPPQRAVFSPPEIRRNSRPELTLDEREARTFWSRAASLRRALGSAGAMHEHICGSLADFPGVPMEIAGEYGVRIHGPIGTGKTRLAVGLMRWHYLSGADTMRFILAGDMMSQIRETFRDDSPRSERQVVDEFCDLQLLVIDDLGREGGFRARQSSEYVLSTLHRILSRRIGDSMPTVVTTNLTLDELEAQYDEGIASRLHTFREVILTGADRRRS